MTGGTIAMIPLKDQEILRTKFQQELMSTVKVDMFTERDTGLVLPGQRPCQGCKPTRQMLQELTALSPRLNFNVHILTEHPEEAGELGVDKIPAIILRDEDDRRLTFYGMPSGTEFPCLIDTIIDLSQSRSLLSKDSHNKLKKVVTEVKLQVMVTPSCPHCPNMARLAYQVALASPHVSAEVIEIDEFPEIAQRYRVRAVPMTIINEQTAIPGAADETIFVDQVTKVAGSKVTGPEAGGSLFTTAPIHAPQSDNPRQVRPQGQNGIILP